MKTPDRETFLPKDVCPALRTKTMALNTHYEPSDFEKRAQSDVAIFWCIRTMDNFGPDEDDAMPETCRPSRSCYCADPEG